MPNTSNKNNKKSEFFNHPIFQDFIQMVKKLAEVLSLEKSEIQRDSAIKRFELCFDLAWKVIKIASRREGLECYSPRECFKIAFQLKLIDYEDDWFKMIEARNLAVHLYAEEYAEQIYTQLPRYLKLLQKLEKRLKNFFQEK